MTGENLDNKLCSLDSTLRSFEFTLRARRKSPHTVRQYTATAREFFTATGCQPETVTKREIVPWLADLQGRLAPATVRHKFAGLRAFFKWLQQEGEIAASPMATLEAPTVPEVPKDVVSVEDMTRVLRSLDGQRRYRDAAIVSLFYDTGMRVSEVSTIKRQDIDWDDADGPVITLGVTKNHEVRYVPFGPSTAARLQRWERHRKDSSPYLFVSLGGTTKGQPFTRNGLFQFVQRIFAEHGLAGIGPHDLRHTFATHFMDDPEAREGDLMTLAGWRSERMARRYTRQGQTRRAIAAHRRLSPVERLQ